jgi:hypothetical protein
VLTARRGSAVSAASPGSWSARSPTVMTVPRPPTSVSTYPPPWRALVRSASAWRVGAPGATLSVVGSVPSSPRVSDARSTPARTVRADDPAHSASTRPTTLASSRSRASTPNSQTLERVLPVTFARTTTGACDDTQRAESCAARVAPAERKGPRHPAASTMRRESSRSTMAVARSSVIVVGAAITDAISSSERGAPTNSARRPCVASSAPVCETRPLTQPPTVRPIGSRAVPLSCTRLAPARSCRSRGRPSVSISSTPERAFPWRAVNPPLE